MISTALQKAEVDMDDALGYLRCSSALEAKQMIALFDSLMKSEKKSVTLDHLAAACKDDKGNSVQPSKVMGIITEQMFSMSVAVTGMIAASKAHDVMRAAVWYAGTVDGHQDRKMLLQTVGPVPVPKSQTNVLNISGNKIDNSVHVNQIPTLESVVGEIDLDGIIDAEA